MLLDFRLASYAWRRIPPAHSPLPASALAMGLWTAIAGADAAEREVLATLGRPGIAGIDLVDSGTSALMLALQRARVRTGRDLVALPAWSCFDLATAAQGAGCRALLYDIDPETLQPEPASLARALSDKPAAVVLVHAFGIPVERDRWSASIAAAGALLVEDAAQGAGMTLGELAANQFRVLSFGRGKGTTGGAGGALLSGAELVRDSGVEGRGGFGFGIALKSLLQAVLSRPNVYRIPASLPFLRLGETVYHAPSAIAPLARFSAGALTRTLPIEARHGNLRRQHAAKLLPVIEASARFLRIQWKVEVLPGLLRLPVLSEGVTNRQAVADGHAARLGIAPGYPITLAELKPFQDACLNADGSFPGAARAANHLLTLPVHGQLSAGDLDALVAWLA